MQYTDLLNSLLELDNKDNEFLREALSLLFDYDSSFLKSEQLLKCKILNLIAQIDKQLSQQVDAIIHHTDFRSLHRNWLSLSAIAHLPINYQRVKLKLLNASWEEVSSDLNQAYSIKSSKLYNKIGNKELNQAGGQPFGCIGFTQPISLDMDFDSDYDDLFTLELIGKLGESTLCPMVLTPSPSFFVESGADWLSDTTRIEKILQGPDYESLQNLRKQTSSKFIALTLPFILVRKQYKNYAAGFVYNEEGDGLWGSSIFPFLATIMREYQRVNWFGFLKSRWSEKYQGAVINVPNLHSDNFLTSPITNINLSGQLSTFYSQQGFIPLTLSPLTNKYYFNGNNSAWLAGTNDNDKVLTQIQTTLMSCRIAHYLKVKVRDLLGSSYTARECEVMLTEWIERYASNVTNADEETLAKYPLRHAKIVITESEHSPGTYACTLRIVPQYQFDHFNGEVVLSTEIEEA
ncbi:type VI secretion system contractile sheath large subunit [Vibrio sp.]|nr:type VI secretion system contractile sheath large subunit [Vibrio sp.]